MNVLRSDGDLQQVWYNRCHRSDGTISGDDGVIPHELERRGNKLWANDSSKGNWSCSIPLEDYARWRIESIQDRIVLPSMEYSVVHTL